MSDISDKGKTCIGFWKEQGQIHIYRGRDAYYDINEYQTFPAVSQEEYDKLKEENARLIKANRDVKDIQDLIDYFNSDEFKKWVKLKKEILGEK